MAMSDEHSESLIGRTVSVFQDTGKFLWKHRGKIAVGGAVCAAGLAAYSFYYNRKDEEEQEEVFAYNCTSTASSSLNARDGVQQSMNNRAAVEPGSRSRMLLRLRKQYDIALKQFLPTLRAKILEVVDVSSAIKRIKELRSTAATAGSTSEDDDHDAAMKTSQEDLLWDEIKVSSFTLLFVSSYMVSALTVLLRVQLHILVRSFHSPGEVESVSPDEERPFGDDSTCRLLIEGTYKHLFGAGLHSLVNSVQRAVLECFSGWSVRDKLVVDYSELVKTMTIVRRQVEGGATAAAATTTTAGDSISAMARTIMLPPEAVTLAIPRGVGQNNSITIPVAEIHASDHQDGAIEIDTIGEHIIQDIGVLPGDVDTEINDLRAQHLLFQTFDVVESPMFAAVFNEAVDTCFKLVYENLKQTVFYPDNPPGHLQQRTPPLATLLPQLKATTARLIPSTDTLSAEVREIRSGPALDTLCIFLFDSPAVPAAKPIRVAPSLHHQNISNNSYNSSNSSSSFNSSTTKV